MLDYCSSQYHVGGLQAPFQKPGDTFRCPCEVQNHTSSCKLAQKENHLQHLFGLALLLLDLLLEFVFFGL